MPPFTSFIAPDRDVGASLASKVEAALTASRQLTVLSWDLGRISPPDEAAALTVGKQRRSAYILLGQFEQLGTRTEIVVQLLRVRDGNPVWSGTYWREPDGMPGFPSELSLDVVEALYLPGSPGRLIPGGPAQESRP